MRGLTPVLWIQRSLVYIFVKKDISSRREPAERTWRHKHLKIRIFFCGSMSFWWFPLFAGLVPTRGRDGHQASAETALMEAINALLFVWWQWAGEAVALFSLHFFGWHFSNSICPGQNRLNQIDGPSYGTEAFCIMKVFTKNSWLGVAFAGRAESLTECVLNILPPFLLLLSSCYIMLSSISDEKGSSEGSASWMSPDTFNPDVLPLGSLWQHFTVSHISFRLQLDD